ncbi:GTPase IMAP family member 7-like isoform X2 [Biomphalaria glabrata]|uniref:GTPase IMAP family member 7-like isoform X2 n=1 Tax=Biomphalaria glabrata TaxID=6526 RepID=A0A9W3B8G9_BIOGL|nr:GTPase IMAP family member 7-like isoform X2 [Biomphalaria glabrata]
MASEESVKDTNYTFIFVGKTGTGKSSLCSRISGSDKFQDSDSGESKTSEPQMAQSNHFGVSVTVVDTAGIMDTSVTSQEANIKSRDDMYKAIALCPPGGKRAIILVLKYLDRFTDADKECVRIVETIFGDECLEKNCIIIMTHGDVFDKRNQKRNLTFENWCQREQGELRTWFEKCKKRILLFRKNDEDLEMNEKQIKNLIQMTDTLDESYTNEKFEVAKRKHKRLLLNAKLPNLLETFQNNLNELKGEINSEDLNLDQLKSLKSKAIKLFNDLEEEDDVYYRKDEQSVLHEPKSQAKQNIDHINDRIVNMLKKLLVKDIDILKRKIQSCESLDNLDKLEKETNQLNERFSQHGLIVSHQAIDIDENRNDFNLQSADLRVFQNVIDQMKELSEIINEKRKELISVQNLQKIRSRFKSLKRDFRCIPKIDYSNQARFDTLNETYLLLNSIQRSDSTASLIAEIAEFQEEAEKSVFTDQPCWYCCEIL